MDASDAPPDPCSVFPVCPICLLGKLELTKRNRGIDICICSECGTGMTVPHEAWQIRAKAERKKL